ncbi:hypothetical protein Trydic_g3418 [Trypoxylus dichotomus]
MNLMETLKHRQTKNHFATAAGVKRSTIAAVLLVLYLPATLQKCHDEKYAQDNCGVRYDYDYGYNRHSCTEYFEMHCYEVTNMLESSHMESVHRIVVNSGDLKFLSSALFDGFNNVESITMIGSSITNIKPNTFFNLSQLQSKNAHIVSGDTREEKNIFGIQCLDSLEDVNSMVDQFNNMTEHKNSKGNEYSESLHKVEQIIQQLSLEQENRSFLIVNQLNKSDTYWRNLTQDYKGLFQTMQQSIKDTLYKITSAFTSSMNTNTIRINELRENGSLEQWKLLQRNFTEALNIDRYNFLDALLSKLQHNFKEINQNIKDVNTPRNTSLKMDLDFSRTSSFRNADEKLSSEEKNRNVLTVGVYGILLVLVVGLVLSLLSKLRSCRSVKNNLEECNPLNSISV